MSFISAGNTTTTTLVVNGDTTGNLVFNTGGANTTALTITNAQAATFVGTVTATGGLVVGASAAPAFSAYGNVSQTVTAATFTKVICNTEEFDTNNNYDSTTNYRFTPTVAGYYQVNGQIIGQGSVTCVGVLVGIYKNGSVFKWGNWSYPASTTAGRVTVSALIYMNGSTDYLELYGYVAGTGTMSFPGVSNVDDYFQACFVRSA